MTDTRRGHGPPRQGRARGRGLARALLAAAAVLGASAAPAAAQSASVSATVTIRVPEMVKLTVEPLPAEGTAAGRTVRLTVKANASWELLAIPRSLAARAARVRALRRSGSTEQVAPGSRPVAGGARVASGSRGSGEVVVEVEPSPGADTDVDFVARVIAY